MMLSSLKTSTNNMNVRIYHDCTPIGDDGSVHSTVTVYSPATTNNKVAPVAEPSSSSCSKPIRHAVHFNESDNEYFENHQMCRQDVQELWYNRFETRAFRRAASALARDVANVEREIQSNDDSSYKNVLQRTFQACLDCSFEMNEKKENTILTCKDRAALYRRMSESTDRLGLERMAIRKLGDDRFARRNKICKMLLDLQKSLLLRSDEANNHDFDLVSTQDAKAEMFRAGCQAISRPSRLFARELACAFLDDDEG